MAPEIILGEGREDILYDQACDMWSFGCILAEMLLRTPFLPGDQTDLNQLATIFAALGTPTEEDWPV